MKKYNQKMTKQVQTMVEATNEYLRYNHIKDTNNQFFNMTCWLLSKAGCYHGYNYFTVDGKLSGGETETFDHLEIYTR